MNRTVTYNAAVLLTAV